MNSKVAVLIATFNGEEYINEQIDSILNQTYKDVEIYVRDDGSKDKTTDILEEYSKKEKRVHYIIDGKKLGYPECFYELMRKDINADVFMFADQDDVWFENKVARAVKALEAEEVTKPVLYGAGYTLCDENLNKIKNSPYKSGEIKLVNALFEVSALEFTMAMNKTGKEMLMKNLPQESTARGTWMCMYFSSCGKILYENEPCAFYRRHDTAVTCSQTNFIGLQMWRIKKFLFGGSFDSYKIIVKDFNNVVGNQVSDSDKRFLSIFAKNGYFPNVFRKIFYPHRLRSSLFDEIALRFAFLIGKL